MKVRAYLAKDNHLVPSDDADRHTDFDIKANDPEEIQDLCSTLFPHEIEYLGRFADSASLQQYLKGNGTIYRKLFWQGPGTYLLWMPEHHRMIYRSDILLKREVQFKIDLEEHIERNSKGDIDRTLMELP